ncbi:signal recognition particle receptor subunit alpha [Nanoarchaeota archaeon]
MVLENLGESLKNTLSKIAKSIFVDEKLINELVKDIQRALLQSDVNVKLVFELANTIKTRALKEDAATGLTKKEHLINIVYEELTNFLGKEAKPIDITKSPTKIMAVGLFGNGKTTTIGKLAKYYVKRGKKVCTVGLDVHRPAAVEQLQQISRQVKVPCFVEKGEKDPIAIWKKYEEEINKHDIILVDTAGRDVLSEDLIQELNFLNKIIQPDETLLVISADIGQAAEKQARGFNETANITGVVITKLDGTAKGGGALIACSVTGAPVKFIGVGEKPDDLESFNPKGFVGRLLGMGDLEALLEKAKGAISDENAEDLGKRFLKGDFNLIDLYEQMSAVKKMGPLSKVLDLVPGMGQMKLPKEMIAGQEGKLKKWKFAMDSMTKEELEDPEQIDANRIDRISKGSGMGAGEIRELLKQYKKSKKLMKMVKGSGNPKDMQKMMKKMQGKMPKGMGM